MEETNDLFKKYISVEERCKFIRDTINGELNRISITDDEEERQRQISYINENVQLYAEACKEKHEHFKKFQNEIKKR